MTNLENVASKLAIIIIIIKYVLFGPITMQNLEVSLDSYGLNFSGGAIYTSRQYKPI